MMLYTDRSIKVALERLGKATESLDVIKDDADIVDIINNITEVRHIIATGEQVTVKTVGKG